MWATAVTSSSPTLGGLPSFSNPRLTYGNGRHHGKVCGKLKWKLRASFSDYPLASRIIVRNIPYSVDESNLRKEFSNFGHVAEVKLIMDEATKRSKGYAFVQYTSQDDAVLALENMDRKKLDGRMIFVELAKLGREAYARTRTCGPPAAKNLQDDASGEPGKEDG